MPSPEVYRAEDCLISWLQETDVPAEVPGVLNSVDVIEGSLVSSGLRLAQVDDSKARMAHSVSQAIYNEANEKAENDTNVRFTKAAAAVAETEYEQAAMANRRKAGAVPELEMRRLQLSLQRANLAVEQAMTDQRILGFSLEAKAQDVKATEVEIARHQISAKSDGMVIEIYRHKGEWVQPGDPVMRVAPMDRLRVETLVRAAELGPAEVVGRPVRVIAHLERGRTAEFHGAVTHVHAQIYGGEYRIWAEVDNRMENGQWLLRPGADTDLEINLAGEITQPPTAQPVAQPQSQSPTPVPQPRSTYGDSVRQTSYPSQADRREYRNPIRQ